MTRPLDAAARARLRQRFAAIPERMKAVARREVEAEAEAMADEIRRGVPQDQGDLRDSIEARDLSTDTSIRWQVTAGGAKTRKPVRSGGKGNAPFYDYALAIEHGHMSEDGKHVPAQPYFYPVHRRRRRRFRARLARQLKKAAKEG